MKLTGIGEVPLKMYSSPWSIRHHRCVLTNISKYFRFSETKRINLNNIDTWLVNSFGFRILELEMATNESFEIGVQISSNPIFKIRVHVVAKTYDETCTTSMHHPFKQR